MILNKQSDEIQSVYGPSIECFHIINGLDLKSKDGRIFFSFNPSNVNDKVATSVVAGAFEVQEALNCANKAFLQWKSTPAPIRASLIGQLGQLIEKNKSNLAFLITREIGKTNKEALGSVQEVIDTCHFFQSEGRRLYGQTVPSEMPNKELFTYRRPFGVVAMITPSNFPIAVPSWKAIPALLTGNTVVWKAPMQSTAVSYVFAKFIQEAGFPKGVFNLIHGDNESASLLLKGVEQGLVHKVSFTGSTRVGKIVSEVCAKALQVPSLELGGKNPMIVMPDANLELAVSGALWSAFGTAGQRCTSLGNLLLHQSIKKPFMDMFMKQVQNICIGDPCLHKDVLYGPMIDESYMNHFLEHFDIAKRDGAKLYTDHNGRISLENKPKNFKGDPSLGYYVWPSVWTNINKNSYVFQNEIFGPAIGVLEFNDYDEAIELANATAYGLSGSIYTQDRFIAYRFKNEMISGMCSINNSTTGAEAHLPFGGMKNSGNSTRESGIWVIDAYTQWQAVNDELSGKLQLAQMDTAYHKPLSLDFNLDNLRPLKQS